MHVTPPTDAPKLRLPRGALWHTLVHALSPPLRSSILGLEGISESEGEGVYLKGCYLSQYVSNTGTNDVRLHNGFENKLKTP